MGLFSKDIQTMDDLLPHGLQDIYYAENQIVKSLPKLIDKATTRDLSKGLRDHVAEIKHQLRVLAGDVEDKDVMDAAIVGSAFPDREPASSRSAPAGS